MEIALPHFGLSSLGLYLLLLLSAGHVDLDLYFDKIGGGRSGSSRLDNIVLQSSQYFPKRQQPIELQELQP